MYIYIYARWIVIIFLVLLFLFMLRRLPVIETSYDLSYFKLLYV